MEEKKLEKHLDNLIIDGLIKEAEQDNADFEAAMKRMSDDEFERIVGKPRRVRTKRSKWRVFGPWITATVAAAAVVLIVLVPSLKSMDEKLCDSALYASEAYMAPSRGAEDIYGLTESQVRAKLPELERRYEECIKEYGKLSYYTSDLKEAGWDLAVAYLKLHKKRDAIKVLTLLAEQYGGTEFGDHCRALINQL